MVGTLLIVPAAPVFADGGTGGASSHGNPGGPGGTDSATGTGGNGFTYANNGYGGGGGGGGGAGVTGGYGGTGSYDGTGGTPGAAGLPGAAGGGTGGNGGDGSEGAGGGGGGGGAHGFYGSALPGSDATGGNGGNGGRGSGAVFYHRGGGGGGGGGGFGLVVTGSGYLGLIGFDITGGRGGYGGGGQGGASGYGGGAGSGGIGLVLTGGSQVWIVASSTITGGAGGYGGIANTDTSTSGGGGGVGIYSSAGTTITNGGYISGGTGGAGTAGGTGGYGGSGGSGGSGVVLSGTGATLTNNLTITGGTGGIGGYGGAGGIDNDGLTGTPGGSGGGGGSGVLLSGTGAILTNSGTITGGNGGNGGNGHYADRGGDGGSGGAGGIGVVLSGTGATLTNNGTINGGVGAVGGSGAPGEFGFTSYGADGRTGAGGAGVALANGATLINSGTINGGASAFGGNGVSVNGGTVINSGTINGGTDPLIPGYHVDAITFAGGGNRLELRDGFDIQGDVNANGGTDDTLALGGTAYGIFAVGSIGATQQYQGFETFEKTGSGTWTLTGTTDAVTPWTISQGTLSVSSDANLGATTGGLSFNGGTLENTSTFTTARAITLEAGGGTLQTDADLTVSSVIAGTGGLAKTGDGTTVLTGMNTYTGGTSISAGTLMVDGTVVGAMNVASGGTLGGNGTVGGVTTVASGGTLIGRQGEVLNFGSDLTLSSGSNINVSLGAPESTGLFNVAGNLTLAGQFNVTDLGGLSVGVYRLFDYDGSLTDNGLAIGTLPAGVDSSDVTVQTAVANQVNLINTTGVTLRFWDGGNPANQDNNEVNGGDGVWTTSNANWTDANGAANGAWSNDHFAIFEGSAGTVTVSGAISIAGMQFATDGYQVEGDAITLARSETIIRTGVGSYSGASVTATIASELTGTGGLVKTDFGTLVLTAANSYAGGTIVREGTLQLGDGGTSGSIVGDVANHGTLAFNRSDTYTFGGVISGTGTVIQAGTGTTVLTGANTYTGGTAINAGTLLVSADDNLGAAAGGLAFDGGTLENTSAFTTARTIALAAGGGTFNTAADLTASGVISGTGALTKTGAGTLTLTGDNAYAGGTTISAGTLQLGDGGTSGSIIGDVTNNSVLAFNSSDDLSYGGVISGSGALQQNGTGTTILTADNTYAGVTTITAGMLQLGNGGTSGSIVGDIVNNGVLAFDRSNDLSYAGAISGTGSLSKFGAGTLTLTAANTYSGGTIIDAGTLSISSDTNLGNASGSLIFNGGTLENTSAFTTTRAITLAADGTLRTTTDLTASGVISGAGALTKTGAGTLTLTGANSYTGGTTIGAGTLQIGDGGTSGSITGNVVNNGVLAFNLSNTLTFAGAISGSGALQQNGTGTTLLTGASTYTGATAVNAGTLVVNGSIGTGPVSVANGATLTGAGSIGGAVNVQDGGTLAGTNGSTLGMGALALNATSNVDVVLGAPSGTLFDVSGDLTLDGTLNLTGAPGFGTGVYHLIEYGGSLTDNGLALGSQPLDFTTAINTATAQQVNLTVYADPTRTQFWQGGSDPVGGSGTWTATGTNWLNADGSMSTLWGGVQGIFHGTPGTVTVEGTQAFESLEFVVDGYSLVAGSGGALAPTGMAHLWAEGARTTATLATPITGAGGIVKIGAGTIVLTANNTYAGGTAVHAGTLSVSADNNLGAATGGLAFDGGTLENTSAFTTGRAITLNSGGGTLRTTTDLTASGVISGAGALTKTGAGTLTLTGANSYTGGTTIGAGTLQIGDGGTSGSITGNVVNNGVLAFNLSNTLTFAGAISGSGALQQNGTGTTLLTGASTYTGATAVNAGTLVVNGSIGTGPVSVANGATLTGAGSIGGAVNVQDGGTLAGTNGSTLGMGALALNATSNVDVVLGAPSGTLFDVSGDLTLDGTLNLTGAPGFGTGVYHLIEYGGSLTDNGLALGSQPLDFTTAINTATAQQVNLTVYADPTRTQFWQGGSDPVGGSGTWTATGTNWLNADGSMSTLWGGVQGIFHGTPGTVTVEGTQAFESLEFVVDGYSLVAGSGGALAPTGMAHLWAEGARTTATLATPITGAGGIVKIGAGTIVLTANNTYAGGTAVHAGTLSVSADNNLGAATGGLAFDGGTLENTSAFTTGRAITLNSGGGTLRTTTDLTASGVISGAGALTKTGAGTLTLTGANSYTGGTTIGAGTLQIGDGGTSGSITGNVVNNGVLAFNLSNTLTFAGAISGSGALQQNGTGTTLLTGASTYTGATAVNAGTLVVNGSIGASSLLTVDAGSLVGGTGTLPATTINGGTLAPGNSIGTINVQGNLALSATATQQIEVSATAADRTNVSGAATLGGTVQVAATPDDYGPHTSYTILHADGGVSGTETLSTTVNSVFLDPTLSFDANNVFLNLTQLPFSSAAWTPNQRAVANALQVSGTHSALGAAVFNQATGAGARQAYDALSGEVHASAAGVMLDESRYVRDAVLGRARQAYGNVPDPLAALGPEVPTVTFAPETPQRSAALGYEAAGASLIDKAPRQFPDEPVSAAWAQAIGAWGRIDGDGNAATLDSSVGGFISGFDVTFANTWRLGLAAGYTQTSLDVDARNSSASIDNVHLALYGGTQRGPWGLRGGAAYTWHQLDTTRSVTFPGFAELAIADYDAATAQLFGEVGYAITLGSAALEPFAGVAYVNLHTDSFTETGGVAALGTAGQSLDATFTTLGLRGSALLGVANGMAVTARGTLGWQHAFGDVTPELTFAFASGGVPFTIAGVPIARDAAVVEAGLDVAVSADAKLGIAYSGQLADDAYDHGVRGNFVLRF
ncbi:autotransporter-associated beta strand repeat-containing protein [Xanthobacter sp. DSM 24535]|uniref:autotransporter-associated beta strand repeat-containing protein n=1 Tax=Roseixanthobacter psychrophilus TaxID=3119917 RepID=UPI0037264CBF